ncbi:MAG: hypothetical protein BIFFINMI_03382 [Phycisphaerae bacterium]|nr:hypothetical protein [Phycisphaerae bacterium]
MPLPRIQLGSLSVSRLILGGGPICGISHLDAAANDRMLDWFTFDRTKRLLTECEARGIDTLLARADNFVARLLREYWNEGGRIQWIAQTAPERRTVAESVRMAAARGAHAVYLQGEQANALGREGRWSEIADVVALIRDLGVPAGVASHDPAFHAERAQQGVACDFALQCLYNLTGYRGRIHEQGHESFNPADRRVALEAISRIAEPVIAYKILGSGLGRVPAGEAIAEVAERLAPKDAVMIGMYNEANPGMVAENVSLVEKLLMPAQAGSEI